LGSSQPPI